MAVAYEEREEWRNKQPIDKQQVSNTYILMPSKVAQELDLTQSTLCKDSLLEDLGDLFDSNIFARFRVFRSTEGDTCGKRGKQEDPES